MGTTVVAVLAESSRPGLVLLELVETSSLSEAEAANLYAAMLKDVCIAAEQSGDDLLVNYRAEDELPDEFARDHDLEAEIRSVVVGTFGGTDSARFEPQVGSTSSTHADDTISHLLNEEEKVHSAVAIRPIASLLGRTCLDNAAMKFRSMSVVLGPSTEGYIYSSDFLDPIDFTDVCAEPGAETLARRTDGAGRGLDYVPMLPVLETGVDLAIVVPMLRSWAEFERLTPEHTTTFVFEEGLRVESTDDVLELVRD